MNTNDITVDKINWRMTYGCNIIPYCRYCFMPHTGIIDEEMMMRIAFKIATLKPKMVVLSGGEPTTIGILPQIIETFNQQNIKVCLATNGISLINVLPNFCKQINTITLPLDNVPGENSYRSNLCVNSVINILNYIYNESANGQCVPKVIINTLLTDNNISNLDNIKKILMLYNVDVWKIFEYIHISGINPEIEPCCLSPDQINRLYSDSGTIRISYENIENKDARYFMVNPDGEIVIPKQIYGNRFEDINIGSILESPKRYLDLWKREVCNKRYKLSNDILGV